MSRRLIVVIGVVVLAVAGVGIALAVVSGGGFATPAMMGSDGSAGSMNSYYQSMMKKYAGSSMMGSSSGTTSYGWMMGGTNAPGWMTGGNIPASMTGTSSDTGKAMGRLFADAPGPRVSASNAIRLGNEVPMGATVDRAHNRISFSGTMDHLVVLANPSGGPDETFRIARLTNPTITVKSGARISIEVVNTDPDAAQGLVIASTGSASSWTPMMTASLAFSGSALWFLGDPTAAGLHSGTLTFTAKLTGAYQYLCGVPGHAQKGMVGAFVVTN